MEKYDPTKSLKQMFHRPNIVPMCGVLLAILFAIMSITPKTTSSYNLRIPEAEFSQREPLEFPTIFIDSYGDVCLNNVKEKYAVYDISKLTEILSNAIKESRFEYLDKILVKADEDIEFGRLQNVLKEIKKADVYIIGLITKRVVR